MKKSIKVRIICLITAAVMLSGAVAVAAFIGSPYDTLKRALLDALTYRNATEESHITMTVNGVLAEESKSYSVQGENSSIRYILDENGNIQGSRYYSKGLNIYPQGFIDAGGNESYSEWYVAQVSSYNNYYPHQGSEFAMFSPEDRNSARMRFIELMADALIGDLKNNITMTSENGIRYIQGTLTESQVPELAKAGIDVLIEQSGSHYGNIRKVSFNGEEYVQERISIEHGIKTVETWKQYLRPMTAEEQDMMENGTFYNNIQGDYWGTTYLDDKEYIITKPEEYVSQYQAPATRADYGYSSAPYELPMKNVAINYVHGEAEIDSDGNLQYIDVSGTVTITNIFDEVSVIDVKATVRISDIGTSNPSCPIPGAEQLFTTEYMQRNFGSPNMGVFFTLNADGSINTESVTTTHPGESMMAYDAPAEYYYTNPDSVQVKVSVVENADEAGEAEEVEEVDSGYNADGAEDMDEGLRLTVTSPYGG